MDRKVKYEKSYIILITHDFSSFFIVRPTDYTLKSFKPYIVKGKRNSKKKRIENKR